MIAPTRPVTAQSVAPQPATIAARKATLVVSATPRKKKRHATAVGKPAISRAIALTLVPVAEELRVALADTLVVAAEVVKSATNAARSDTSLVTALKAHTEGEDMVVRAKAVTGVATEAEAAPVKEARLATRAEGTATCLATAPKVKNATTVRTPNTALR